MDQKDRQIIRELQANGRLTNLELSERVNLSPSPCLRRLRQLEKSGVIKGYTALVDQKAYGVPLTVFTIFLVPVVRDAFGWGWAFALLAPGPFLGAWAMLALGIYALVAVKN